MSSNARFSDGRSVSGLAMCRPRSWSHFANVHSLPTVAVPNGRGCASGLDSSKPYDFHHEAGTVRGPDTRCLTYGRLLAPTGRTGSANVLVTGAGIEPTTYGLGGDFPFGCRFGCASVIGRRMDSADPNHITSPRSHSTTASQRGLTSAISAWNSGSAGDSTCAGLTWPRSFVRTRSTLGGVDPTRRARGDNRREQERS